MIDLVHLPLTIEVVELFILSRRRMKLTPGFSAAFRYWFSEGDRKPTDPEKQETYNQFLWPKIERVKFNSK